MKSAIDGYRREGSGTSPGKAPRAQAGMPGKYRHGLALAPRAWELAEALLHADGDRALALLVGMLQEGLSLEEIEEEVLAPALTKLGEMWIRGRIDGARFTEVGTLAESVEEQFHRAIGLHCPAPRPTTSTS